MNIPYKDIRRLLDIRLKQIQEDALEFEDANLEHQQIEIIKSAIGKILIMHKNPTIDLPAVGEVKVSNSEEQVYNEI
ncbi:MAG: hypothetical protein J7L15_05730 [Clostridiales bacterium]|nr:hypothetical protein [Clostridiales bacterium]